MIIRETKYVIATKEFPLLFEDIKSGYDTNKIQTAMFYNSESDANNELDRYNNPEQRIILPVTITYEI